MSSAFIDVEPKLREWYAELRSQDQVRRQAMRAVELTSV